MNRTTATCIAGMRSKTTTNSRIHFFPRPREAKPFTRSPKQLFGEVRAAFPLQNPPLTPT